jgi:hypothetical protein
MVIPEPPNGTNLFGANLLSSSTAGAFPFPFGCQMKCKEKRKEKIGRVRYTSLLGIETAGVVGGASILGWGVGGT